MKSILTRTIIGVGVAGGIIMGIGEWRSASPVVGVADPIVQDTEGEGVFLRETKKTFRDTLMSAARKVRPTATSTTVQPRGTVRTDSFSTATTIEEQGSASSSSSKTWWVNSGGRLRIANELASTIAGDLSTADRWYTEYLATNPIDTDNGLHPQNIFRLVQRELWQSFRQEVYARIDTVNMSTSPNRNASNGVLLFNRYQSGDSLYYAGIRVDGAVVIKKKYQGTYYTLATKAYFAGAKYDRTANPTLLPQATWIGIRTEVTTTPEGSALIVLSLDEGKTGVWKEVLRATDTKGVYGADVITNAGYAGIRTDFMDVSFDDYRITAL